MDQVWGRVADAVVIASIAACGSARCGGQEVCVDNKCEEKEASSEKKKSGDTAAEGKYSFEIKGDIMENDDAILYPNEYEDGGKTVEGLMLADGTEI